MTDPPPRLDSTGSATACAADLQAVLRRSGAGAAPAAEIADDLVTRYREPHRHHHTLEHVAEMLDVVGDEPDAHADEIVLAVWYHDAIYDPTSATNEADSAHLATTQLSGAGVPHDLASRVADLVRCTAAHTSPAGDRGAAVLLDADLAVLAAAPARYRRYVEEVRAEYHDVPDGLWRAGRARVLEGFLDRPRLFLTEALHARLDVQARANLTAELATLRGSDG